MLSPENLFLFAYLFGRIIFCLLNKFQTIFVYSLLYHTFQIYLVVFYH